MFEINLTPLNIRLIEEADSIIRSIMTNISDSNQTRSTDCCKKFESMVQQLEKRAESVEILVEIENYIDQCRTTDIKNLRDEFFDCYKWLELL